MSSIRTIIVISLSAILLSSILFADESCTGLSGAALFGQHCAACHPDGGNILNARKTLHRKDLLANNVKTVEDIVKKMRNPGAFDTHPSEWSGMKMFDEAEISDEDALKIANFIHETFK
jgi:cytochrome c6